MSANLQWTDEGYAAQVNGEASIKGEQAQI